MAIGSSCGSTIRTRLPPRQPPDMCVAGRRPRGPTWGHSPFRSPRRVRTTTRAHTPTEPTRTERSTPDARPRAGGLRAILLDRRQRAKHLARPHVVRTERALPDRHRRRMARLALAAAPWRALARRARAVHPADGRRAPGLRGDERHLPPGNLAVLPDPDRSGPSVLPGAHAIDPGGRGSAHASGRAPRSAG